MENRRGGELIGAVIVFFLVLFVYIKIAGPIPFTVNNINTLNSTPFEVSGTGKASAAPDTAVINLGVTQTGSTVLEAQTKTNQASDKITTSLKNNGVEEKNIKTTNYSVTPNYSFSGETQKITGYTVTQNFEVKVPIEKANQVVDSGTSNGANLVGDISFTLDDAKEAALKNEARSEAVAKAKASAQGLAKASGISLGNIVNVRESFGGDIPTIMPMAFDTANSGTVTMKASAVTTSASTITPGQSNVEVTVVLTYQVN